MPGGTDTEEEEAAPPLIGGTPSPQTRVRDVCSVRSPATRHTPRHHTHPPARPAPTHTHKLTHTRSAAPRVSQDDGSVPYVPSPYNESPGAGSPMSMDAGPELAPKRLKWDEVIRVCPTTPS